MDIRSLNMRSHLARVRGLGANHIGAHHFWALRLTSIAIAPLVIWFVVAAIDLIGADYATFVDWVGRHYNPVLLGLLIVCVFHHAQLGLQVIIEDYVSHEGAKVASIILVKFAAVFMGASSLFAVARLTFGS